MKTLSRSTDPESPNGVIFILPPLLDNARHSPPPPPLEVRVAEVVVERNINLSPPSTDAVNATTTGVPLVPSSSSSAPPEVVRPRAAPTRFAGKSNEEAAAILIQTIFRAYLSNTGDEGFGQA
ncbi:IQ-domain 2 [Raphanus sativus]|nr:IQ-domain 2 [Raphanus sativus]KAJ4875596.1 IQ-domain 2 [Raphanus sativus]